MSKKMNAIIFFIFTILMMCTANAVIQMPSNKHYNFITEKN